MTLMVQSRQDSGIGFQFNVLKTNQDFISSLGSGTLQTSWTLHTLSLSLSFSLSLSLFDTHVVGGGFGGELEPFDII